MPSKKENIFFTLFIIPCNSLLLRRIGIQDPFKIIALKKYTLYNSEHTSGSNWLLLIRELKNAQKTTA